MRRLSLFVVLVSATVVVTGTSRAQTPTFLPVYDNHLILPFACPADGNLTWSQAHAESVAGLGPGDDVRLLYDDGAMAPAKLGTLTCLRGECRGDYAALSIEASPVSERIIAVADSSHDRQVLPLAATETPGSCLGLPPQGEGPHGFGFPMTAPLCTSYRLKIEDHDINILVAGHGWMQENGWPIYRFFYRIDGINEVSLPWSEFDEGTAAPAPAFAWNESDSAIRILWTRREGIAGPPAITFREQRIQPDDTDRWISTYQAGGQPCD